MCLIAFALDFDAACPLLIAANRDEFLDRPTAALHRWSLSDGTEVVAGRDLRDGGTWFGVSPGGRLAMLTNVRNARCARTRRSRGGLVTLWLQGDLDAAGLQAAIDPEAYGGFNLVVGDFHRGVWAWLGNRDPARPHQDQGPALHTKILGPGIYGLSNATLDTPWPKTEKLKLALTAALTHLREPKKARHWCSPLREALSDDSLATDAELPHTGVPNDWERALSSPFVRMAQRGYATRSSLLLRVAASGAARWRVDLDEWTHAHDPAQAAPTREPLWRHASHRRETLSW